MKLIVSDMDGTLIHHDESISKKNLDALRYAINKGVKFMLATGRDYQSIHPIMERYQLPCMAILGNGAQCVDESGKILMTYYFPKHQLKNVLNILKDHQLYSMIFTTSGCYTVDDPEVVKEAFINRCIVQFSRKREDLSSNMPCMMLEHINSLDEFIESDIDVIKVEAFDLDINKVECAKAQFKEVEEIAYLSSFKDNVEVTHINAQKGLILQQVIDMLGIKKEDVMVLGDGYNDLTLFQNFPYSFAPSNAQDGIKELAYRVVSSCEEDGVSEAIYMMIKE